MRRMVFVLTAVFMAPTAVIASATNGVLTTETKSDGARPVIQNYQIALVGSALFGQPGASVDSVILVKGDQSGNGPGAGGHKGQKKGGHHGKQKEGKDNPDKKKT